MTKRRKILAGGAIGLGSLFLTSFNNAETPVKTDENSKNNDSTNVNSDNDSSNTSSAQKARKDILMNGSLIFGPASFFATKVIVLDLGSLDSKNFYETHKDTISMAFNESQGIGIALVDYTDTTNDRHGISFAFDAATLAIGIFEKQPELFWDYLSMVYSFVKQDIKLDFKHNHVHPDSVEHVHVSLPGDETTLILEDFIVLARDIGVSDEAIAVAENEYTSTLVRNMSMVFEGVVTQMPSVMEYRHPAKIDLNDSNDVNNYLLNEIQ